MKIAAERDPGSFRDPSSVVFYRDDRVLRALDERALTDFRALRDTAFFGRAREEGRIVATDEVDEAPPPGPWAGVVEHERIPFVSYPYEWPFAMLRAAALLQLDLLEAALADDITMIDATPYNVQFAGTKPVFIDIGSFRRLEPGEPWAGYRQFCSLFLYPLMLRAYKEVSYRPWLRGSLDGISPGEMRNLVSRRDRRRRGVLLHVVLQARAEKRYADTDRSMRDELRSAGFRKEMITANVRRLRKTIEAMRWDARDSGWTGYASGCDHVASDRDMKARFVEGVLHRRPAELVWDLGANDGFFSRLAARRARTVVAMDVDEPVVDRLYDELVKDRVGNVLPLVVDLADPSPGLGWDGRERRPLADRGTPDLVLCLAVIHHLIIGRNIPAAGVVDHLASLRAPVVLELVGPEDPMVKRMTLNKRAHEIHRGAAPEEMRAELARRFRIEDEQALPSGHRTLLSLVPHD